MTLVLLIAAVLASTVSQSGASAPEVDSIAPVVIHIAPAVVAPVAIAPASDKQRYQTEVVCRSSIETGSLIKKRKSCLTAKQWEYVDQAHRDEARKLMMDNMGKPPGD